MTSTYEMLADILDDRQIGPAEVDEIRCRLHATEQLETDDVRLLIELYCGARDYTPAFEDLFFDVLERVFLADGEISPSEQYYLLKMLYGDRRIRPRERQFLRHLRESVRQSSPEFEALCREALGAPDTDWSLGGK